MKPLNVSPIRVRVRVWVRVRVSVSVRQSLEICLSVEAIDGYFGDAKK